MEDNVAGNSQDHCDEGVAVRHSPCKADTVGTVVDVGVVAGGTLQDPPSLPFPRDVVGVVVGGDCFCGGRSCGGCSPDTPLSSHYCSRGNYTPAHLPTHSQAWRYHNYSLYYLNCLSASPPGQSWPSLLLIH